MWAGILNSMMLLAGKVLDQIMVKTLMKHIERIADIENQLNGEYSKPLNNQDDLLITYLEDLLEVEKKAFERQLMIGVKAANLK